MSLALHYLIAHQCQWVTIKQHNNNIPVYINYFNLYTELLKLTIETEKESKVTNNISR